MWYSMVCHAVAWYGMAAFGKCSAYLFHFHFNFKLEIKKIIPELMCILYFANFTAKFRITKQDPFGRIRLAVTVEFAGILIFLSRWWNICGFCQGSIIHGREVFNVHRSACSTRELFVLAPQKTRNSVWKQKKNIVSALRFFYSLVVLFRQFLSQWYFT